MAGQDLAGLEQGIKPYGSYEGGDIDSVSMVNGNLTLHIPLISYPQRGGRLHMGFALVYSNPILQPYASCNPIQHTCSSSGYNVLYHWGAGTGRLAIGLANDFQPFMGAVSSSGGGVQYYTVTEFDGAIHEMGQMNNGSWISIDATGYSFTQQAGQNPGAGTVMGRDGNRYNNVTGTLEDANGNLITANITQGVVTSWNDTLGRVIPAQASTTSDFTGCVGSQQTTNAVLWAFPGPNGGTSNFKFCYASFNISFTAPDCIDNAAHSFCTPTSGSSSQLQSVVLPNNTAWIFEYDNFGELSSVTLPTGGTISYAWNYNTSPCGFSTTYIDPSTKVNTLLYSYGRGITSRTVNANDGTGPHTWQYSITGNPIQAYVTDPLGNDSGHTETLVGNTCSAYETEMDQYSGSHTNGSLLKKTVTSYNYVYDELYGDVAHNVVPTQVVTTNVVSGKVTQETKTYDPGVTIPGINSQGQKFNDVALYGDVLTQNDYDYGSGAPGSLLRTATNTYMALSGPNATSYLANNLLDLPYTIQVTGGGNSATTQYGYDETGLQTSNVTEQKVAGESYPGNQTSVHRWLNGSTVSQAPCSVSVSNGYLVSNNVFYDTGQVQQSTDPCGYATTYQYSPTYFGAYPTAVTNALGQTTTYAYDFNSGSVTSIQDPNTNAPPTTKSYDVMDRLLSVTYPNTGSTSYCYTDGLPANCSSGNSGSASFAVVETKAITSSTTEISTATLDGMARLSQTQLNSDPSGTTYTLTTYDAMGRKSQAYNPTRCSTITSNCKAETTWGFTTTNYDALSRPTSVVEQDGSVVTTTYDQPSPLSGNNAVCSTVTDEAGNSRQSCDDGLGRVTAVLEDPGAFHLNYQTLYTYDALNNLLSVTQNGSNGANARTRTFAYDSLSHLLSASNPESGNIAYAYDADGNVITKTAPLPNQTQPLTTVTATYAYDKLNRLIKKSYAEGGTSDPYTPRVQFAYDGGALTGCTTAPPGDTDTYPVGRRTSMCDGSGATNWTHDTMGRVLQERRTIGGIIGKYDNDAYNLDGSVQSVTALGYSIGYTYNRAGEPLTVKNYTDPFTFMTGATYAPHGALTGMTLGAEPITVTNAYNARLQPILLSAATTSATLFSECFDFHLNVAITTPSPCSFSASTKGDNGNVYTIVNNRDNTRTQNFIYDSLNRIQQAYTSGSEWGETFGPVATAPGVAPSTPGIDAWGNMTNRSGVTGKTNAEPSFNFSALTSNQLSGFGYDAAGNMTSNTPTTYVYDAENRLIATGGTSYVYDGDGNRVEKCTEGTTPGQCASGATGTLYWRGTGGDPQAETDLAGNVLENYVFLNGQRIARRDPTTEAVHFYFSDHLGSHSVVENATGTLCEQDIDYYPYGGVENDYCAGSGVTQHYKFTGKERDTESGLDMFGARYYGSSLGRFVTPDWAAKPVTVPYAHFGNPQSLNLYSYVNNNPTTVGDSDGHCPWNTPGCTPKSDPAQNTSQQQTPQTQSDQKGSTTPTASTDSSKKSDPSTVPVVVAGAGLPPAANGPANAAKDAAKNFMKSTKPDRPLRDVPGETPDAGRLSPLRQLMKDTLDAIGEIIGGAAGGSNMISAPVAAPDVQKAFHDPASPLCQCST